MDVSKMLDILPLHVSPPSDMRAVRVLHNIV